MLRVERINIKPQTISSRPLPLVAQDAKDAKKALNLKLYLLFFILLASFAALCEAAFIASTGTGFYPGFGPRPSLLNSELDTSNLKRPTSNFSFLRPSPSVLSTRDAVGIPSHPRSSEQHRPQCEQGRRDDTEDSKIQCQSHL